MHDIPRRLDRLGTITGTALTGFLLIAAPAVATSAGEATDAAAGMAAGTWHGIVDGIWAMGMAGGGWGGGMGGVPFLGFLWPLLLLAGLVWLLSNGLGTDGHAGDRRSGDTARETLRERYARGEISEDEFEARRRRLER